MAAQGRQRRRTLDVLAAGDRTMLPTVGVASQCLALSFHEPCQVLSATNEFQLISSGITAHVAAHNYWLTFEAVYSNRYCKTQQSFSLILQAGAISTVRT